MSQNRLGLNWSREEVLERLTRIMAGEQGRGGAAGSAAPPRSHCPPSLAQTSCGEPSARRLPPPAPAPLPDIYAASMAASNEYNVDLAGAWTVFCIPLCVCDGMPGGAWNALTLLPPSAPSPPLFPL